MDAEIISMDHICMKLFTMICVFDLLVQSVGMAAVDDTITVSMHEYN